MLPRYRSAIFPRLSRRTAEPPASQLIDGNARRRNRSQWRPRRAKRARDLSVTPKRPLRRRDERSDLFSARSSFEVHRLIGARRLSSLALVIISRRARYNFRGREREREREATFTRAREFFERGIYFALIYRARRRAIAFCLLNARKLLPDRRI